MLTALIARLPSLESTPRGFEGFVTSIVPMLEGSSVVRLPEARLRPRPRVGDTRSCHAATAASGRRRRSPHTAIAGADCEHRSRRTVCAGRRRANALGKVAEGADPSATGPAVATHRSSAPATDRGSTDCVPRRPLNRPAAPRIAIREVRSQLTACYGARHPRHGMDRLRTTLARCSANSRHARAPPAGTTQASPSSHRQGPATVCLASPCENHRCPCDDDKIVAVVLCNPLRCPLPRGA